MIKKLLFLTLHFILISCTFWSEEKGSDGLHLGIENFSTYVGSGFVIDIPLVAKHQNRHTNGGITFTTNNSPEWEYSFDDYYLSVDHLSSLTCTLSSLGTSEPVVNMQKPGEILVWGEIDQKNDGTYSWPNCLVKSIYPDKNPREHLTAYGLCAEKDGRKILICITQVTKDFDLAKQIFSTFRWTE